jgi:hypothetical protein
MDKYTKVVLTLIAFALWANLFVAFAPPGRGPISEAHAQGISYVVIKGIQFDPGFGSPAALPVMIAPGQPAPVYLTPGPATGAGPMVLPVNVMQIGTKWVQQGAALPVDIEGIAGAAVKTSGGLPVALASTQPLPVTAKDPLQVVVTKLPPAPAAIANQASTSQGSTTSTNAQMPPAGGPGQQ